MNVSLEISSNILNALEHSKLFDVQSHNKKLSTSCSIHVKQVNCLIIITLLSLFRVRNSLSSQGKTLFTRRDNKDLKKQHACQRPYIFPLG